jgi:hypothetical protein
VPGWSSANVDFLCILLVLREWQGVTAFIYLCCLVEVAGEKCRIQSFISYAACTYCNHEIKKKR